MGNVVSNRSATNPRGSSGKQYLGSSRLPIEVQDMITAFLCPSCSVHNHEIPSAKHARELQRSLGQLAATSKQLLNVANQHRFHAFVMSPSSGFSARHLLNDEFGGFDGEIGWARRLNNEALPEMMERLINYGQLRQHLRFLSILSNQTSFWLDGELWLLEDALGLPQSFVFDAWMIQLLLFGLTPKLRKLLIDPLIVQEVFLTQQAPIARIPSVTTLAVAEGEQDPGRILNFPVHFQMEALLLSFPNLQSFQSEDWALSWSTFRRAPAYAAAPPFFPNLRNLVLAAIQPGRLHHVSQVLPEFSNLEELYYYRRTSYLVGQNDPDFSNAGVFQGVKHCLRKLTYTSALVEQHPGDDDHLINIYCYEEQRFSDVPHFGDFAVLEDLKIDQGLLGRMSTVRDRIDSQYGPYFPELDWKLPQSLRRLTVQFVYDWPRLAAQLIPLADAKANNK
ncbi:hypothetical protein J7T55_001482 [Diaporthe amygdali]|uniref:uncharacterized protein n=1 Tax=Phomopsis amygdali TaxID=1214568 RepID=UPI0022FDD0B6|nr:uncharacterized protein J7T55_001482 [Diaporthe amygdali]KAJ0115073.1 hypothetical protein J7T55_001482 [Diaporthe amygdali]